MIRSSTVQPVILSARGVPIYLSNPDVLIVLEHICDFFRYIHIRCGVGLTGLTPLPLEDGVGISISGSLEVRVTFPRLIRFACDQISFVQLAALLLDRPVTRRLVFRVFVNDDFRSVFRRDNGHGMILSQSGDHGDSSQYD